MADGLGFLMDLGDNREDHAPLTWQRWLETMFLSSVSSGFADHHCEFWDWV